MEMERRMLINGWDCKPNFLWLLASSISLCVDRRSRPRKIFRHKKGEFESLIKLKICSDRVQAWVMLNSIVVLHNPIKKSVLCSIRLVVRAKGTVPSWSSIPQFADSCLPGQQKPHHEQKDNVTACWSKKDFYSPRSQFSAHLIR